MDRVFTEGSAYAFEKPSDQGDATKGLLHTKSQLCLTQATRMRIAKEWNSENRWIVFGGTALCDIVACRGQLDGYSGLLRPVPFDMGVRGYGRPLK
jgi:hypothetical protein